MSITTTRTTGRTTTRLAAGLAGALTATVVLSACSGPVPDNCSNIPTLAEPAQALIVVVGVHAGAPAPDVPAPAAPLLQGTLAAGNPVRVIGVDGTPALEPMPNTTVSDANCDAFAVDLATATNTVTGTVRAATADSDGNDLYNALALAANTARANSWDNAHILVINSGLADTAPLNFARAGMTSQPPEAITDAAEYAVTTQPIEMSGLTVTFYGLGQSAPPQPGLSPAEQAVVAATWVETATTAGAANVTATPVPRTGPGPDTPHTTTIIPTVGVRAWEPPQPPTPDNPNPAPATLTLTENDVYFDTDQDQPRDPDVAAAVLAPVIAWLAATPTGHITLHGRTDSRGGRDYNRDLSTRRAEAIKALILAADPNITSDQITTIGQGYDFDGYLQDHPGGTFDPTAAAANRHVLLTATTT